MFSCPGINYIYEVVNPMAPLPVLSMTKGRENHKATGPSLEPVYLVHSAKILVMSIYLTVWPIKFSVQRDYCVDGIVLYIPVSFFVLCLFLTLFKCVSVQEWMEETGNKMR